MSIPPLIIFDKLADRDSLIMRNPLQRLHVFLVISIKFFDMVYQGLLVQYTLRKLVVICIYPSSFLFLVRKVKSAFSLRATYRSDALELHWCS